MKVFIAGATGAIGTPLVKFLLQAGHEIFALTQSQDKAAKLLKHGVTPLVGSALNRNEMLQAMKQIHPEAVINMLTSLPKNYTPEEMRISAEKNAKIRLEGGANLQLAAKESGVRRCIIQSAAFWYAPGPGPAVEIDPFAFEATPGIASGCRIYEQLEKSLHEDLSLEGMILRFGFFYGPGTWFYPGESMAEQVMKKQFPLVKEAHGIWNFVHIEDAAKAIVAALHGPPGIYNINDDDPSEMSTWLPAYARWLQAPLPLTLSSDEYLNLRGADSLYYATRLRAASNAKAKKLLHFKPRPLEWLQKKS